MHACRSTLEDPTSCAGPTRRDFLAAAALAGWGAAAGLSAPLAGQDSARRISTRFVGDAFERGHHWTTPDPEKLYVARTEKKKVVVVGGGIAGIVAAWRLLEAGVDEFVVLELEDKPGGLARNGLMGKTVVPFGGVTMGVPDKRTPPAVSRLLELAGASRNGTRFLPDVFEGGRWVASDTSSGPVPIGVGNLPSLDHVSVEHLPGTGMRSPGRLGSREDWCLRRFGARPADVSAAAFLEDFGKRFPEVLVIPNGFSTLLAPLVAKLGARLLTGRVAVLVKPEGAAARVRAVNANDAVVTDYEASAVVLALPPFIAAKITPALRERDKDLVLPQTTPWLVTAAMVSEWPKRFSRTVAFHEAADERASLILHAGEPPEAVIVCHRPFPASAATPSRMFLRDLDPDSAREWAFRELAPVFPDLPQIATRVELWRVGHGSIRPGPGWITKIAPKLREPLPPLYPCGADLAGVPCAESAITDGVRGAEAVLESFGKLDKSWL